MCHPFPAAPTGTSSRLCAFSSSFPKVTGRVQIAFARPGHPCSIDDLWSSFMSPKWAKGGSHSQCRRNSVPMICARKSSHIKFSTR
eukprot:21039-Prymnesium_polylepis.1